MIPKLEENLYVRGKLLHELFHLRIQFMIKSMIKILKI